MQFSSAQDEAVWIAGRIALCQKIVDDERAVEHLRAAARNRIAEMQRRLDAAIARGAVLPRVAAPKLKRDPAARAREDMAVLEELLRRERQALRVERARNKRAAKAHQKRTDAWMGESDRARKSDEKRFGSFRGFGRF